MADCLCGAGYGEGVCQGSCHLDCCIHFARTNEALTMPDVGLIEFLAAPTRGLRSRREVGSANATDRGTRDTSLVGYSGVGVTRGVQLEDSVNSVVGERFHDDGGSGSSCVEP